jgi:hypothetical protein
VKEGLEKKEVREKNGGVLVWCERKERCDGEWKGCR